MDEPITYQVWRFNSARDRLTQDKKIAEYLGDITSYQGAFDLMQGFGYLAYFDTKKNRWVSYGEMAASFGQQPWASMQIGS